MATPSYARSLAGSMKRLKLSPSTSAPTTTIKPPQTRHVRTTSPRSAQPSAPHRLPANLERELAQLRLPKAVQATYLAPLKHSPTTTTNQKFRSCDLYLSSYSIRNLEVFADFAQRAAYFLNLSCSGPQPLPRKVERWTVPRSNFVHKKSQENFERVTLKRKLTILNGNSQPVAIWLAFLRKYQYYGVGMKANVFEHGGLDAAKDLDWQAKGVMKTLRNVVRLSPKSDQGGGEKLVIDEPFKASWGAYTPSGGAQSVPHGNDRRPKMKVNQKDSR